MKAAAISKEEKEGWFDAPHPNDDTESLIFLTPKSFTHAYSNLSSDFGEDTILCMAHIPEIIKNAILVSVDDPRNNRKMESKVYTFFGAVDGVIGVEPVKLTVKEFNFKLLDAVPKNIRSYFEKNGITENYNSLYDAQALEVIGIEGINKEPDASARVGGQSPRVQGTSDPEIRVADLLKLVNGDSEKYIPKNENSISFDEQNELLEQARIEASGVTPNSLRVKAQADGDDPDALIAWVTFFRNLEDDQFNAPSTPMAGYDPYSNLQKSKTESSAHHIVSSTKNGKNRIVTPPAVAFEYLSDEKRRQVENRLRAGRLWSNKDNLVFTNDSGRYIVTETWRRSFKRLVATIGRPDLRCHDLRHSCATIALAAGADIKSVQSLLGHATASFTLDVYSHATDKMVEDTALRMQNYFNNLKQA